ILKNEQTEETYARRNHPAASRERGERVEPGEVLPAEGDVGSDAAPLAQEIRSDGRCRREAAQGAGEGKCRLEADVCRGDAWQQHPRGGAGKQALSAGRRRELARQAVARQGCSQRQACRLFSLHRATCRYRPKDPRLPRAAADEAVVALSLEHPELGADKIASLVRRQGHRLSNRRARQLRREECLRVAPRKPKESRRGESTGRHPQKAAHRGHVWTWDFIHDWTLKGGAFRVLSVVDEYTRE